MSLKNMLAQRSTDPVFYRKTFRDVLRRFARFADSPVILDLQDRAWDQVAVVIAHPDDETFCSGLICELISRGSKVSVICLTKGEGGPTGGIERAKLGAAREEEMNNACAVLGVEDVTFLGHVDPVARKYRVYAPDVSVEALADQIEPILMDSDLIVSHGSNGEYWHPAHLRVFDAIKKVMNRRTGQQPDWLTFLARNLNHEIPRLVNFDDEAHYFLDVSSCREAREKALGCHQSQLSLFGRFAGGSYGDFIAKTSRETFCDQRRAGRY